MRPPPAPLAHRLFHLVGRARAAWMLRGFHRAAQHARATRPRTGGYYRWSPGLSHNQLKTPHLLTDPATRGILEDRAERSGPLP